MSLPSLEQLFTQAQALIQAHEHDTAENLLETICAAADSDTPATDQHRLSWLHAMLMRALNADARPDPTTAHHFANTALSRPHALSDPQTRLLYRDLANLYATTGMHLTPASTPLSDPSALRAPLQRSIDAESTPPDPSTDPGSTYATTLYLLAALDHRAHNHPEAEAGYQALLSFCANAHHPTNATHLARSLRRLIQYAALRGDTACAFDHVDTLVQRLDIAQPSVRDQLVTALDTLRQETSQRHLTVSARNACQTLIDLYEERHNPAHQLPAAHAAETAALLLHLSGRSQPAYQCSRWALHRFSKATDPELQAACLRLTGTTLSSLADPETLHLNTEVMLDWCRNHATPTRITEAYRAALYKLHAITAIPLARRSPHYRQLTDALSDLPAAPLLDRVRHHVHTRHLSHAKRIHDEPTVEYLTGHLSTTLPAPSPLAENASSRASLNNTDTLIATLRLYGTTEETINTLLLRQLPTHTITPPNLHVH